MQTFFKKYFSKNNLTEIQREKKKLVTNNFFVSKVSLQEFVQTK